MVHVPVHRSVVVLLVHHSVLRAVAVLSFKSSPRLASQAKLSQRRRRLVRLGWERIGEEKADRRLNKLESSLASKRGEVGGGRSVA